MHKVKEDSNPDIMSRSVLRAVGNPGRRVPGREGPEAGGVVEGNCFPVERRAGGGPAGSVGEPTAEAAGSGCRCHTRHRPGCGEKSAHGGALGGY